VATTSFGSSRGTRRLLVSGVLDLATITAFLLAGLWGAGNSIMPLAAGGAHGSEFREAAIRWVAYSAAPTGITAFALIFWGLRMKPEP
jgi:(hydroxyamino)benzene mutase